MRWQRPGFDLALKIEAMQAAQPQLRGVIMGGHGVTTWAETSDECERLSLEVIQRAGDFIEQHGNPEPLGPLRAGFEPLDAPERRDRALSLGPLIRGLASTDRPVIGRWFDDDLVLDFIGREATPRLTPLGTSCPDHFIRTKVRPLLLDLPTDAPWDDQVARLGELHEQPGTRRGEVSGRVLAARGPQAPSAPPTEAHDGEGCPSGAAAAIAQEIGSEDMSLPIQADVTDEAVRTPGCAVNLRPSGYEFVKAHID